MYCAKLILAQNQGIEYLKLTWQVTYFSVKERKWIYLCLICFKLRNDLFLPKMIMQNIAVC